MFFFFRKRKLAEPFVPYTMAEASIAAGVGASVLVTLIPLVGSYAGIACAYLWGSPVVCGLTTSALSDIVSGSSSGMCTSYLTYYITNTRHKKWLVDNAGKYVRNNINGRLTRVPAAFITPFTLTSLSSLPLWVPVVGLTCLSFGYNYITTKRKLAANNN